jgi:hypothetical protein
LTEKFLYHLPEFEKSTASPFYSKPTIVFTIFPMFVVGKNENIKLAIQLWPSSPPETNDIEVPK